MMNSRQPEDIDVKAVDQNQNNQSLAGLQRSDAQLYSVAVVPIAIPLTVGAGTFSAVILFADLAHKTSAGLSLFAAILALVIINYIVFNFSVRIVRFAGDVGLSVFTKIMGLFTLAIGVEFVLKGLITVYHQVRQA